MDSLQESQSDFFRRAIQEEVQAIIQNLAGSGLCQPECARVLASDEEQLFAKLPGAQHSIPGAADDSVEPHGECVVESLGLRKLVAVVVNERSADHRQTLVQDEQNVVRLSSRWLCHESVVPNASRVP